MKEQQSELLLGLLRRQPVTAPLSESDGTEISGEEKRYKMLWVLDPELFLSLYPFLNDACLSLSLFISSPAGLLLPAIFFFFFFFLFLASRF